MLCVHVLLQVLQGVHKYEPMAAQDLMLSPHSSLRCGTKVSAFMCLQRSVHYATTSGVWYPVCGYSFWNNLIGAAIICEALELEGGTLQQENTPYTVDAMPVGACNVGEPLDACTLSPPTERGWGDFGVRGGWCERGNRMA